MRITVLLPIFAACLLASPAIAQTQPAGPTKPLNYHDKPAEEVLTDLSRSRGFIIVKNERLDFPMTLTSSQPVSAADAINLLNDALWDHRFLLYTSETGDHKLIVRVTSITTRPPEVRIWPHPTVFHNSANLPAFLPGVTESATLSLKAESASLSNILNMFAQTGVAPSPVAPADDSRLTLFAPKPLTARQSAEVVSEALLYRSQRLESDMQTDPASGQVRTHLRVVPIQIDNHTTKVAISFNNAPLAQVLAELGKRSGFAITDDTTGIRVSLNESLTVDADGLADIGPLLDKLIPQILEQGAVVQCTARPTSLGKTEPLLWARPSAVARKAPLQPPPDTNPKPAPSADWVGVDPKATLPMHYQNVTVDSMLKDISKTFGFVSISNISLPQRISLDVPEPVTAEDALSLAQATLIQFGYQLMIIPSKEHQITMLRVMPMTSALNFLRNGNATVSAGTTPAPGNATTQRIQQSNQ